MLLAGFFAEAGKARLLFVAVACARVMSAATGLGKSLGVSAPAAGCCSTAAFARGVPSRGSARAFEARAGSSLHPGMEYIYIYIVYIYIYMHIRPHAEHL